MTPEERKEIIDKQANRVITLAKFALEEDRPIVVVPEQAYIDGYCRGFVEALKIENRKDV